MDINSRQDAVLMLSAVTLPDNAQASCGKVVVANQISIGLTHFHGQRRRTDVDELNMRTLFQEGDLIAVRATILSNPCVLTLAPHMI